MSTVLYCSKQAAAMSEFATERAKAKLDAAIDADESRDELIAARTQELVVKRMAEMATIDVQAGMQSILEGLARMIGESLKTGDYEVVGIYVGSLIKLYIERDSEVLANDWMSRIEREVSAWGH
jgi:hypothetical protein